MSDKYDFEEVSSFSDEIRRWIRVTRAGMQQRSAQPQDDVFVRTDLDHALEELAVAEEELRAQCNELLREADQAERERTRYRHLFEFLPLPVFVTDIDGVIREANWAAISMLEEPRARLEGKRLTDFVRADCRAEFEVQIRRLRGLESVRDAATIVTPASTHDLDVTVDARHVPGRSAAEQQLQWVIRPHEAKKADGIQQEADASPARPLRDVAFVSRAGGGLSDRNQSADEQEFIGDLVHELRSPVSAIVGYCNLFENGRTDLATLFFHRIHTAAKHQMNLIEQLSQLHRGVLASDARRVQRADLRDVVRAAAVTVAPVGSGDLTVGLDMPDAPVIAWVEPARMRQALVSLLSHAAQSTSEPALNLVLRKTDNEAVLRVTGAAAGAALQASGTRQAEMKSDSGLSLAIAKRLVASLDGEIRIQASSGEGTTFMMRLPLERECGQEIAEPAVSGS